MAIITHQSLQPGADARAALVAAAARVSRGVDFMPQNSSNIWWSVATLGWELGADTRAALEAAVVRVGPHMNEQDVSNTWW